MVKRDREEFWWANHLLAGSVIGWVVLLSWLVWRTIT